jgi:hypothetical protein
VNDGQTPAASLTVSASSSNPTLLPNGNITFGGAGIVRNVSLNPVSGQTGTAQITITVTDSDNMTAQTSFNLFVGSGPNLGIVFADDFSGYSDGQSLSFVGDAFGGAWHTTSGTAYQLIVSNQQAFVSIPTTNTEDIGAMFTNGAVSVNSGAILYTGCKFTQTALPTGTGEYFLHLKDNTTSNFFCRLFATPTGAATNKFRLGLSNKSTTGPNVIFPVDLDLNTTYNVAMRYKVSAGVSTLWVNPTSINDATVTATDTPNLLADISQVALREPGTTNNPSIAGSQIVDNLVVSTSFSDVVTLTAAPPTLKTTQGASSFTITWPTNNNSGYVLQSASTVNATTWNPVGGVTTSGANYTVTIPYTSTPAYFRLKK